MGWSFTIARIAGTAVKVHVTFLLLLAYYAVSGFDASGAAGAVDAVVLLLSLFGCVLLHEFGHIFMARRFGVRTPDVLLLPIGGVARLERIPDEPKQELLIALAGPAVTLAIAVACWAALVATGADPWASVTPLGEEPLVARLFSVNVGLLLFNLVPAFPMDGGRVLRAALASRLGRARATRVAARIGQFAAALMMFWAFRSANPVLGLVGLFVFFAAASELQSVEQQETLKGLTVERLMLREFRALPVGGTLAEATEALLAGEQREFPVVDGQQRVLGLLTRDGLIRGLTERGPQSRLADAMARDVPALRAWEAFEPAVTRLRESGLPALPVTDDDGVLRGLVTLDNITDVLLVRRARRSP